MSRIACIPARGGSKRVPRKNVRDFAGRPMIAWAIATALASRLFERLVVSTDDAEIAEVAEAAGAEVPFERPAELADDHAATAAVMAHAADALGLAETDELVCIYPATPLLTPGRLAEAGERFARGDVDYVFAAQRFAFPPQRGLVADGAGVRPVDPAAIARRSQDLEPVYHDAGQFYWASATAWRDERPLFGPRSAMVLLAPWEAVDIDEEADWLFAERLFALRSR